MPKSVIEKSPRGQKISTTSYHEGKIKKLKNFRRGKRKSTNAGCLKGEK